MLKELFVATLSLLSRVTADTPNMNGPNLYGIANPNMSSGYFSTNFTDITPNVEYMDLYSAPITSRYAGIYWTMMPVIPLPKDIVSRFNNKVMAITGYEMDQVIVHPNGTEESVPCTWSYNHHYVTHLQGANSKMIKVKTPSNYEMYDFSHSAGSPESYKFVTINESISPNNIATSQTFSSANGGESRGSFHGYPYNKAQLIHSPKSFYLAAMQIDTRNRDPKYINDKTTYHPGLLPKNNKAPPNAAYSGLAGCPCTDRIKKVISHEYSTQITGSCKKLVVNNSECYNQIVKIVGNVSGNTVTEINTWAQPSGCFFIRNNHTNKVTGILNIWNNSATQCGSNTKSFIGQTPIDKVTKVATKVSVETLVTIELVGPSNVWFGVAFNAKAMSDLPYTIIVNSSGAYEYKLGKHTSGTALKKSINITENRVINNTRYIKLTREKTGETSDYYSFTNTEADIPLLTAIGTTQKYSYHKSKSAYTINMKSYGGSTCICNSGTTGTINGLPFHKNCLSEPYADLIQQGNPTCFVEKYTGGLSCCHNGWILLDKDQVQPNHTMTFQIKFRFWYTPYKNQTGLVRSFGETERNSGEYDVVKCPPGTPTKECVHIITSRFQGKDMVSPQVRGKSRGFKFVYVSGHCHYGSCLTMVLSNADTGELVCHVSGDMGQNRKNVRFDEKNYVKLNPCIWGEDKGLMKPKFYSWNTNFTSIKRANATDYFTGEMALWQNHVEIVY